MEDQSTEDFIEIVKSNNILWDLTNPDHKNVKKKAEVWKNISEEFGLPTEFCKRKWKSLRDSCCRDINRDINNKNTNSGEGAEESESIWKYRENMSFIRDHRKPRTRLTPDSKRPSKTCSWNGGNPKKPKTAMEATFQNTMESVQEFLKKPRKTTRIKSSSSDDEDDLFCKSLVKKLKKFPITTRNDAKLEMLRYLNGLENGLPDSE